MKKLFLLVFLGFFIQNAYSQCADTTNIYKFTFNGKNYEVVKELKSWTVAAACAVERGGYLVQIGNLADAKMRAIVHSSRIAGVEKIN